MKAKAVACVAVSLIALLFLATRSSNSADGNQRDAVNVADTFDNCEALAHIPCRRCKSLPESHKIEPCVYGCVCPPACLVSGGACYANPRWVTPLTQDPQRDLVCLPYGASDPVPDIPRNASRDSFEYRLAAFQRNTAWLFRNWYRWSGQCIEDGAQDGGAMSASYDKANGGYILRNVCLQPSGKMSGYLPSLEPFEGLIEYDGAGGEQVTFVNKHTRWWMGNVTSLPEAPSCFVNTPAVMVALDAGFDNPVHMLSTVLPIHNAKATYFPHVGEDDVLTVVVDHTRFYDIPRLTGLHVHFAATTQHWASLMGYETTTHVFRDTVRAAGRVVPSTDENVRLCFQKIVMVSPAYKHPDNEEYRLSFRLLGHPRQIERDTGRWYRRAVARCADVSPPLEADTRSPALHIAVRTVTRPFTTLAYQVSEFVQYAIGTARVRSVTFGEDANWSPNANAKFYLESVDLMISFFGAALGSLLLLPRGAVSMEIVSNFGCPLRMTKAIRDHNSSSTTAVLSWHGSTWCEYAKYAAIAGAHHGVYRVPVERWDNATRGAFVTAAAFRHMLDAMLCKLRHPERPCLL